MAKHTIGGFISALRRSAGLTQQQLAEQVGVSNKAVSRWENDVCLPELTLIPVLADLFEVTADELLRGERSGEKAGSGRSSAGRDRRIDTVLAAALSRLTGWITISVVFSFLGLVLLFTLAYGARRSILGAGFCFFCAVSGAATALVGGNRAVFSAGGKDFEGPAVYTARKKIVERTLFGIYAAIASVMLSVPYFLQSGWTAYENAVLTFGSWLKSAPVCIGVSILLSMTLSAAVNTGMGRGRIVEVGETLRRRSRAAARWLRILAAGSMALFIIALVLIQLYQPRGTVYQTWDDFYAAIETPVNCSPNPAVQTAEGEKATYGELEYILDSWGNPHYFRHANMDIVRIDASDTADGMPVKTYSEEQLDMHAEKQLTLYGWAAATVIMFLWYLTRSRKKAEAGGSR